MVWSATISGLFGQKDTCSVRGAGPERWHQAADQRSTEGLLHRGAARDKCFRMGLMYMY